MRAISSEEGSSRTLLIPILGEPINGPEAEVGGLCSGQEGQHQKDVLLLGVSP